jgi:hypothetical protein
MSSAIADLGTWAGTGLGTSLRPADRAAKRLAAPKIPEGNGGLGLSVRGGGWVGHTGHILGWKSVVASHQDRRGLRDDPQRDELIDLKMRR